MAYTLLIADDDAMIRKGLTNLMPWSELGFQLVDVLSDGKALMQRLSAQPADVVLTDIRMHEVSGLMVAKEVFENHIPTRMVILSGYSEFEYAQQALRYGVKEYLLKPISIDALRETFERIRIDLDRERSEREYLARVKSYAEGLAGNMDALFVGDALAGLLSGDSRFAERMRLNSWEEKDVRRLALLLEVSCPPGGAELVENALRLLDDGCAFHPLQKRPDRVEGLLLEKRQGTGGILRNTAGILDSLNAMTGMRLELSSCTAFDDLRQLCSYKRAAPWDEEEGPVAKACAYIRANYSKNITLNDVAAQLYVNPAYLSRVFHEKIGQTFTETLTRIRLDAAIERLKTGDMPISEIARVCGYPSSKYFYKQFKRYMGISPGEWRSVNQKREGL